MENKIKIIACRVLETELTRAAEKNNITVVNEYLEAGLHDNPKRLVSELQAAIDKRIGRLLKVNPILMRYL